MASKSGSRSATGVSRQTGAFRGPSQRGRRAVAGFSQPGTGSFVSKRRSAIVSVLPSDSSEEFTLNFLDALIAAAADAVLADVENLYDASQEAQVNLVGLFLLVLLPIAIALLVWRLPDDPAAPAPQAPFRRGFAVARSDALFRMPLYLDFLTGLGQGITAAVFVFAATHAYGLPGRSSLLLLGYFVAGLATMPVWIWAARRFGAEQAYSWACLWITLVVVAYWFVPAGSLGLLAVVVVANGLAIGPPFFLTRTLMADAIDRTERDGDGAIRSLGFAMLNMSNKISGALAVGLAFGLLALFGFDTE